MSEETQERLEGKAPPKTLPKKKKQEERSQRVAEAAKLIGNTVTDEASAQAEKSTVAALALATARRAAAEKILKDKRQTDETQWVWYLECPRCLGPGVWMFAKPSGPFDDATTEASYKPRGMPYLGTYWICQCCLAGARNGLSERNKLPTLNWGKHKKGPLERCVRQIPRYEYDFLIGELEQDEYTKRKTADEEKKSRELELAGAVR